MGQNVPDEMMRIFLFLFLFLQLSALQAQSLLKKFAKISTPEKCWAFAHPFVARKALKATMRSYAVTDSIKRAGSIGADNSGGKLDAFKHAFWMACVSRAIGPRKALKLGVAHEKGNKLQFKKHQLEEGVLPDSISSVMDLHNNEQGAGLLKGPEKKYSMGQLQEKIMQLLLQGQLVCIKKDEQGNFLTCTGKRIDLSEWKGKWGIPKCLIASNEH
jgi:hypothetical protein